MSDGVDVNIGGIMEHIEEAGVHSGDSSCSLPPYSLTPQTQDRLREQVRQRDQAGGGFARQPGAVDERAALDLPFEPRAQLSQRSGAVAAALAARRGAAVGDALATLLEWQGVDVHREFYYNDAGAQIANLALSVQARAKGIEPGGPRALRLFA